MQPMLKHITEFREVLQDYKISEDGRRALEDLRFVAIVGPSSSGRNTVIRELAKTDRYHFVISDTTRPPRMNDGKMEENGVEYYFRTEEEMLEDLRNGRFLEAELIHNQQVSGISLRELQKAKEQNKIAITDMDLGGVTNVMRFKPDATAVLLLPPSFEEWQRRMTSRGRMSNQELRRRMDTAVMILKDGLNKNYYRYVIADNVAHAAATIDGIVSSGAGQQEGHAKEILQDLQYQLQQKLESMKFI
jgi:guanylate kinase